MFKISSIYPQYTFIVVKDTEWDTVPYDNVWEYQFLNGVKISANKIEYKPKVHLTELNKNNVVLCSVTK